MRGRSSVSDHFLYWQAAAVNRADGVARRVRRLRDDERGQTPTEYLMIVGLMAAVIVLVFVTFYWKEVKTSAQSWVAKVKDAIVGKQIN